MSTPGGEAARAHALADDGAGGAGRDGGLEDDEVAGAEDLEQGLGGGGDVIEAGGAARAEGRGHADEVSAGGLRGQVGA
jgi:hypothetical protein